MLDSLGRIPERNAAAVREAMSAGIIVTISTGRMYKSASMFAGALGLGNTPIVCYNGAMIRDPRGDTPMHLKLDLGVAAEMLAIFRERGFYVQSYIDDELYVKDEEDDSYLDYSKNFGVAGIPVGDELFSPKTAPTKLLARTSGLEESHALIGEFTERFRGRAYVTSSNADFVEMMHPGAGKEKCVRHLAQSLGIPMENVMTMGDGDNDTEMLRAAGIGIAMGNARDDTKAAANATAPANDECGVAWAIEKYALGRG
jgi:Cof subfamily protein (haloacid dehalogenase superfamily)